MSKGRRRAGVVTTSPAPVKMSISIDRLVGQAVAEAGRLDAEAADRAAEGDRAQLRDDVGDQAVGQGRVDEVLVGAHALHVGGAAPRRRSRSRRRGRRRRARARRVAGARSEEVGGLLGQPHGLARPGWRRTTPAGARPRPRGLPVRSARTKTYSAAAGNGGGVRLVTPREGRERGQVVLGEPQSGGRDVLLEVADVARAGDREHVLAERQGPGDAHLGRGRVVRVRDGPDGVVPLLARCPPGTARRS